MFVCVCMCVTVSVQLGAQAAQQYFVTRDELNVQNFITLHTYVIGYIYLSLLFLPYIVQKYCY